MGNFRFILLAFLLWGGQQALLLHGASHMDANHPDHVCEVCLHAAPLDNGITAGSILFASPILVEAPLPAYRNSGFTLVERLFDARGPPVPRSA